MTTSPPHLATEPVTDDAATIAAALDDLSVPALIAAVVTMTGDPSFVRGPIRPREFVLHEFQGRLTDDEQAELRRQALMATCAWRDAGCPPADPLAPEVVHEIMSWIACEPVPDDYAAVYAEELDLTGADPRAIGLTSPAPEGFSVLVIGSGFGGLLAGVRLKQAGIPFRIIEKNDDIGGTWLENTYPGARVDVASHFYSFSFEPLARFSEYYARQPELYAYLREIADRRGIVEHITFSTEVERARWDEAAGSWRVTLRGADGRPQDVSATAIISGVGVLNRPSVPDLPGLEDFAGPAFHSAQWDHSADLTDKRVALIGAGASGFQIGPAIVDRVRSLTVFQRTPQWMAPNARYHAKVKDGEHWAMRHLPGYARWYRFVLLWSSSDKMLEMVRIDPDWHDFPRTANALSFARRKILADWIAKHAGDDLELRDKATPSYPPLAKRMLQDDGSWLRCLTRDHVELVNDHIENIEADAVVTADGRHPADVIILATGFRANDALWPMEIVGRDGMSLEKFWDRRPAAYNGSAVPGFPNFFILNGPGTGLAHAGSVVNIAELSMRYIGAAIRELIDGGHRSIEPSPAAYGDYNERHQAELRTLMWGHPSIEHSWYKAADGNVYILSPWRIVDLWKRTATVDRSDHVFA